MGLRILYDEAESIACMYDSVTGWAFGPVFENATPVDSALAFINWLPQDARAYNAPELEQLHAKWTKEIRGE